MSITPVSAAAQGVRAHLQIVRPRDDTPIPLCFNPTEYQISKANTFADIPIPGLETPLLQYVRGDSEKLSVEALVDSSNKLEDVRVLYVDKLRKLMSINSQEHAPPLVAFVWDRPVLSGVLESLAVSYVLFTSDGIPLRAKLTMSLREYRSAAVQAAQDAAPVAERGEDLRGAPRGHPGQHLPGAVPQPGILARTGRRQRHHGPAPPAARAGAHRAEAEPMTTQSSQVVAVAPDPGYAPEFAVGVEGQPLGERGKDDVLEIHVVLDLDQMASFEITFNNWDDELLRFKYSESEASNELFKIGRLVAIELGYADELVPVVSGQITSLNPAFPAVQLADHPDQRHRRDAEAQGQQAASGPAGLLQEQGGLADRPSRSPSAPPTRCRSTSPTRPARSTRSSCRRTRTTRPSSWSGPSASITTAT